MNDSLKVGLKEWAVVCRALESGRQMVLLRKGGIYEASGEFEVEHPEFLLFPTYLHQNLKMLKEEVHSEFQPHASEPEEILISSAARVTDIVQLSSRQQMDRIEAEHVWTSALIDMRFMYRPENPLYLLIVRAYRLEAPVKIRNTAAYAGCKSWVPMENAISTQGARVAIEDAEHERRRGELIAQLSK